MATKLIPLLLASLAACRAGGSSNPTHNPDAPGGGSGSGIDAPAGGGTTTIKNVRMNQPTNGTVVNFQNVVVVAHVSSKKYGKVWVQDAGGGQYSGIELFCNYGGSKPNCAMTQAQIDALAIGTVVNASGMFDSFLLSTAPAGAQPNLEIDAPMITPTSGTMTPVAVTVDAATIAKAQQASSGADPYKGTYVKVTGSSFAVSSVSPMEFASTCTDKSTPPQNGTTYGGFEVGAGGQTLAVGLGFYNTVTYCLPCTGVAMPYPCANAVTATETFTSLSGVVEPEYNSNGQVYLQISPTSDSDIPHA